MSSKSREEYEHFIYSLPDRYPVISFSTLVLKTLGATVGKVEEEIHFPNQIRLKVFELVDFAKNRIVSYTYQVYRAKECLYWYFMIVMLQGSFYCWVSQPNLPGCSVKCVAYFTGA